MMLRWSRVTCVARAAGLAVVFCVSGACEAPGPALAPDEAVDPAARGVVHPIEPPITGVSRAPQLSVHGDRVLLSWLEHANFRTSLRYAVSTPEGWSEPRVAAEGDDFVDNAADISWVRALDDGTLVAQWLHGRSGNPEAYAQALAWSRDDGRTWSPPVSPHHDGTDEQHGFASLFQPAGSWFGVVWLDGRDFSVNGFEDGTMGLWTATFDQDGEQTSETLIDTRVCECCQTSAAVTSDGVIVAYRDRSDAEVRDIQVIREIPGGWSPPTLVHADGWMIHGCPVNGPAITAQEAQVAVAWFTAAANVGRTFVAYSADGGRTFDAPVRVDDAESRGLVDVEMLSDGAAAVSWIELTETGSEFRVRRVDPDGTRSRALVVADVTGGHYPRVARVGGDLWFAWTAADGGYTHVRTARVSVDALADRGD